MIIGRILLTLTLLGKIAPNYNAARSTILSSFGYDINNYSTFLNCMLTIPLLLISTLIVVFYQNVGDYVDFQYFDCYLCCCFYYFMWYFRWLYCQRYY